MFWRGVFGYLPVQATQALVGFGAIFVFTRLLTPEQYGQYALALAVATLVHALLLVGLEACMERFTLGETERGDAPSHFATLHLAYAVVSGVIALGAAAAILLLPLDPHLRLALTAAFGSMLTAGGVKLIQERRRAQGRVTAYAAYAMSASMGGFGLGAVLAANGWGAASALAGMAVANALVLVVSLLPELRLGRGGRYEPERLRRYLAYGMPVALSLILAQALFSADRFLIAAFLDEASVGYYHAGHGLAYRTLDILFTWIALAGSPAMITALERGGQPALKEAARTQAEVMVLICLPAAVGLALVARPIAEVMVGPELRQGAARVIPWIAASGFLGGLTTYYLDHAFTLAKRPGLLVASMAAPAAACVGLNLLLIPRFGLDGAMWASTTAFATGALVSWILARRVLPLPLPWRTIAGAGFAVLVMTAAVRALPPIGGFAELVLKAGVGAVAYGVMIAFFDVAGVRSRAAGLLRPRPALANS
jgi:O-antigen/teichoic acid export membrane protein